MTPLPAILEALGWGIWMAVQPCPLAANVAAIAYLARRADKPSRALFAGVLYAIGQMIVYVVLAIALLGGLHTSRVSVFLQSHGNQVLGPVLVLVGMVFLDLLPLPWRGAVVSEAMRRRMDALGIWAALPLGMLLALAFCPVSAACFFVTLFRLLARYDSRIVLPAVFGIGAALPVVGFAVLLALGAQAAGRVFNRLAYMVRWMQRIAGLACLAVGVYYCLAYIFEVSF